MNKKIVLATKNKGKVKEFNAALSKLGYEAVPVSDIIAVEEPVEDGNSFMENALLKANYYAEKSKMPCIADDSGLAVEALNGAPGIYSARYAGKHGDDEANNSKLIDELKNVPFEKRIAAYVCALALVYPDGTVFKAEGRCEGIIQLTPQGNGGFGYDPYFYLKEYDKTMAEISMDEKNKISHRGKALRLLVEQLENV